MKPIFAVFALAALFGSTPLAAQEPEAPAPAAPRADYSPAALQRLVSNMPVETENDHNVEYHVGGVSFRALGTRWMLAYVPVFMPLSGSGPGDLPDPFALSGTPLATTKRSWRTERAYNAELMRIQKSERSRVRVKVQ